MTYPKMTKATIEELAMKVIDILCKKQLAGDTSFYFNNKVIRIRQKFDKDFNATYIKEETDNVDPHDLNMRLMTIFFPCLLKVSSMNIWICISNSLMNARNSLKSMASIGSLVNYGIVVSILGMMIKLELNTPDIQNLLNRSISTSILFPVILI